MGHEWGRSGAGVRQERASCLPTHCLRRSGVGQLWSGSGGRRVAEVRMNQAEVGEGVGAGLETQQGAGARAIPLLPPLGVKFNALYTKVY